MPGSGGVSRACHDHANAGPALNVWHIVALGVVFSLVYTQLPLYTENQNEYFLRGLVRAGFGMLRHDWLAHTADATPAFSLLVTATYRVFHQRAFYLEFMLVLGVYLYSLVGIASSLFGIAQSRARYFTYLALVLLLFSPLLDQLPLKVFGFDVADTVYDGVAYEGILRHYLQPSTLGALLLLSVHLFLRGRPLAAVVASSLAAVFHPIYMLGAATLTLGYMLELARRGASPKTVIAVGATALGVALPILAYIYIVLRPTSPETWRAATAIFVHFAVSDHADLAKWWGPIVLVKGVIVLAALCLVRRTGLFAPMVLLSATAAGLSAAQVASQSDALALLMPWRLSVLLVPLSSAILLAAGVSRLVGSGTRYEQRLVEVGLATLGVVIGAGLIVQNQQFQSPRLDGDADIMAFVKKTKSPGDTYLVPFDRRDWYLFEAFRLRTGAPTFVDHRLVPKKDVDIVEWYRRLRFARGFYEAGPEARCRLVQTSFAERKITHVIVKVGDAKECADWRLVFRDDQYALMMVSTEGPPP